MKILVTGATGFLGGHVVRQLLAAGHDVRALVRRPSAELARVAAKATAGSLEQATGDVLDAASLVRAVQGVEQIQHLAGQVTRTGKDTSIMMRVHVDGTRALLEAAAAAKVARIVVASSSGTIAVSKDPRFVATEDLPFATDTVKNWPYYLSKIYQEELCLRAARDGAPIVILSPSLLLGPGDARCSSTDDVRKFLQRKIPVLPEGGVNFVDARDAAATFVAATEKGQMGERYLLGGPNWTVETFFGRLSRLAKVPAPRLKLKDSWARAGATLMEEWAAWRGTAPSVDRVSVEMAQHYWYIDSSKAKAVLGFDPRDPQETLVDTIKYLREHFLTDDWDGSSEARA